MKPPLVHVVTPISSSGKLWEEVQRRHAVEAESARTIAHLNQTHREVSEMQQIRIAELEKALREIAAQKGRCIYSLGQEFREGSNAAFEQMSHIASSALKLSAFRGEPKP